MLEALLNNKLHSSDVNHQYEDVITSTVLGRIKYLSPNTLWSILYATCNGLPDFELVKLKQVDFWPSWKLEDSNRVEPDVFFEFELGDPAKTYHIIIEAKADSRKMQLEDQWQKQINTYLDLQKKNELIQAEMHFFALGGKPIKNLNKFNGVNIHQASWFDFYSACEKQLNKSFNYEAAVLTDICRFLNWRGFSLFLSMCEIQCIINGEGEIKIMNYDISKLDKMKDYM